MEGSALRRLSSAATAEVSPPPFLSKTYDMVEDPATDAAVSWSKGNNSFVVWNVQEFARDLLPKYFKHNNFSSFVRQLNTYGFRKIDPDNWEFANEGFLRGHKHLLTNINRRKAAHAQGHQQSSQIQAKSACVGSCIEVGKFGIEDDVEMLKRDKNVLMQELVRLRQQQQSTDHQLQTVGQRVHVMEQRQQQMMSFLAKAMHSPGSVAQLVQQQSESNRHILGGNKKRKLPNQDETNLPQQYSMSSSDGPIVKYHPLMNEAAQTMLQQILKINTSGRLDAKMRNLDGFLIDDVSSNTLDTASTSSSRSGVTLSEVAPSLVVPSDIQSSSDLAHDKTPGALNSETNVTFSDFFGAQGIISEKNTNLLEGPSKEASTSDVNAHTLLGDIHRLPSINDAFWEQFLSNSPFTGDTDESNSGFPEYGSVAYQQTQQEGEQDKLSQLNDLTEQMELLASASHNI